MSRWKVLDRYSPSGKQLFECGECGRVSPTPDKHCGGRTCGGITEEEAMRRMEELTQRFNNLLGKGGK